MSFNTRKGTRGSRQPNGRFLRWVNTLMAKRLRRSPGGKMMGFSALILTTSGRRSGIERTNPVGWFPGANGSWIIVASANGAIDNPAWYYNLAANPNSARIEVDGQTIAVTAIQLDAEAREQAWQQVIAAAPRFAQYQQKTDRELPVIQLVPRQADGKPLA